mmetsp:Transcript_17344/g.45571  ORF Transcript_17344/g.45571 Transcript_17344/m.45571 type:complete len:234 (+) Transcript_17344:417-1118(+)
MRKSTKIAHAAACVDPSNLGPRQMVQVEGLVGPVPRQPNFVVVAELRLAVHDPDQPMLGRANNTNADRRQEVAAARRRPVLLGVALRGVAAVRVERLRHARQLAQRRALGLVRLVVGELQDPAAPRLRRDVAPMHGRPHLRRLTGHRERGARLPAPVVVHVAAHGRHVVADELRVRLRARPVVAVGGVEAAEGVRHRVVRRRRHPDVPQGRRPLPPLELREVIVPRPRPVRLI